MCRRSRRKSRPSDGLASAQRVQSAPCRDPRCRPDRRGDAGLAEQPGHRNLRGFLTVLLSNLNHPSGNLEVHRPPVQALGPITILALGTRCGAFIEATLIRPGENTSGQRRPGGQRHPGLHTIRVHLALFLTVDEVVVVLHRDELRPPVFLCGQLQLGELPGEHRRAAQVEHLPGLHEVVQRFDGWVDWTNGDVVVYGR